MGVAVRHGIEEAALRKRTAVTERLLVARRVSVHPSLARDLGTAPGAGRERECSHVASITS